MPYDPNIPAATQRLKDSQGPMQNNFAGIQTAFSVNHGAIGGPSEGKHTKLLFPVGAGQVVADASSQIVMYSKISTDTGVPEIFVNKTVVAANGIPFTASGSAVTGGVTIYWTFLPSGMLFKFGKATFTGNSSAAINLNAASMPVFSALYSTLVEVEYSTSQASSYSLSGYNLTLHKGTTANVPVAFFVIGLGTPTP